MINDKSCLVWFILRPCQHDDILTPLHEHVAQHIVQVSPKCSFALITNEPVIYTTCSFGGVWSYALDLGLCVCVCVCVCVLMYVFVSSDWVGGWSPDPSCSLVLPRDDHSSASRITSRPRAGNLGTALYEDRVRQRAARQSTADHTGQRDDRAQRVDSKTQTCMGSSVQVSSRAQLHTDLRIEPGVQVSYDPKHSVAYT